MTARGRIWLLPVLLMAGIACAGQLGAQELSAGWQVLGTFRITLDDTDMVLHAVREVETGNTTLKRDDEGALSTLQIGGVSSTPDGTPGVPILTITLGPFWRNAPDRSLSPSDITVDLREADRVLMATPESETAATLNAVELHEDGSLNFTFEAELAVMAASSEGGFEPAAGLVPARIVGSFSGRMPAP